MVELGRKYECPDCGIKFYDLGRVEAACPKCGRDLKGKDEEKEPRATPSRAAPARAERKDEADEEEVLAPSDDTGTGTDADADELEDLDDIDDDDDDDDDEEDFDDD